MMQFQGICEHRHEPEHALEQSIHDLINKVNIGNITIIIKQLLKLNLGRGRSFVVSSVMEAQDASPTCTNVYAALVAAINSRVPHIGYMVLKALIVQLDSKYKGKDKNACINRASFIAHLVNQRVAHENLAVQILSLLVQVPTATTVDIATAFLKECGQKLTELCSEDVNAIFARLRNIQLDEKLSENVQSLIKLWKDGVKDHPAIIKELEVVPEEEQFIHEASTVVKFQLSSRLTEKFELFCIIPTLKQSAECECVCAFDVLQSVIRPSS